jgi:hypothetical protein
MVKIKPYRQKISPKVNICVFCMEIALVAETIVYLIVILFNQILYSNTGDVITCEVIPFLCF